MRLVAVIPAHNEEAHIRDVVLRTLKHVDHVVVVDDASMDGTDDEVLAVRSKHVTLLRQIVNFGKGSAVRTGCDYALEELGADLLVLIDGDGQHEPEDIPAFLKKRSETGADIVFGFRKRSKHMPWLMRVGNWALTFASVLLFHIRVKDSQCGYRLLLADAYRKVRWDSNDYAMESEMIVRAGVNDLRHAQMPIKTIYHDEYKGTGIVDGVMILLRLLRWRATLW